MAASVAAEGWQLDASALPTVPRTHVQQNFTSHYAVDTEGSPRNDLAFRLHANGLCVVALAPSHAALCSRHKPAAVAAPAAALNQDAAPRSAAAEAQADQQTASAAAAGEQQAAGAQLTFSPKLLQAEFRKGRGPLLHADTILGRLTAGGREFVLRCGVRGLLVELNPRLPDLRGTALLRELERGYLAVLDVRAAEAGVLAARCLPEPAYQQRLQQRAAEQAPGAAAAEGRQQQPGNTQCAAPAEQQQQLEPGLGQGQAGGSGIHGT